MDNYLERYFTINTNHYTAAHDMYCSHKKISTCHILLLLLTVPMQTLQIILFTAPIDNTSRLILLGQAVIEFYGLILLNFFLGRTRFIVQPLTAHFFASRQMQLLKVAAAQGLGNSCTEEPNGVEN